MKKEKLETELARLAEEDKKLTQSIKDLTKENSDLKNEMERASEDRSADHAEYAVAVSDQRVILRS